METVRNDAKGLVGRAIAGPHGYDQIPALVQRGRQRVRDLYSDLEERLTASSFVAGEAFSTADITAVVAIDFASRALSMPVPDDHPGTSRWYEAICERASFTA